MVRPILRSKSVGTKLTEEEYAQLERRAESSGQSMSEWVRESLLQQVEERTGEETVLAELLGVRAILLNLLYSVANGERVTKEQMQTVIERADAGKAERARRLLSTAGAANGKEESGVQA